MAVGGPQTEADKANLYEVSSSECSEDGDDATEHSRFVLSFVIIELNGFSGFLISFHKTH